MSVSVRAAQVSGAYDELVVSADSVVGMPRFEGGEIGERVDGCLVGKLEYHKAVGGLRNS